MIKKVLFCLILVVSGCSSAPKLDTQFFVLTPDTQSTSIVKPEVLENELTNAVVLDPIKLAVFLDQPGIVLQTDAHQIEVAHYHRWGEPLKRNIHRFILETLTTQIPQQILKSDSKYNLPAPYYNLEITVNQFNGTTDGLALLSGHWALKDSVTKTYRFNKPFSYHASLANSGYPELVTQLAGLLEQLSNDIASTIKASVES